MSTIDDKWRDFPNEIILQAVMDYKAALQGKRVDGKKYTRVIKQCERFFRSEWFQFLSNLDGEMIIRRLRKQYEQSDRQGKCGEDKERQQDCD